ncbi:MAG: hypothetical protein ACO3DK_08760, partial [Bacteroidia bacterium]
MEGVEAQWQTARYNILDPSSGGKGTQRVDMRLRSFGRFAWAAPNELQNPLDLTLRLAEAGSVPLQARELMVVYSNPSFCQRLNGAEEFRVSIDAKRLQALACRSDVGDRHRRR